MKENLSSKLARIELKIDQLHEKIREIENQFYVEMEENGTKNVRSIKDLTVSAWAKIKAIERDIMPLRFVNTFPRIIAIVLIGLAAFVGLSFLVIKNIMSTLR